MATNPSWDPVYKVAERWPAHRIESGTMEDDDLHPALLRVIEALAVSQAKADYRENMDAQLALSRLRKAMNWDAKAEAHNTLLKDLLARVCDLLPEAINFSASEPITLLAEASEMSEPNAPYEELLERAVQLGRRKS